MQIPYRFKFKMNPEDMLDSTEYTAMIGDGEVEFGVDCDIYHVGWLDEKQQISMTSYAEWEVIQQVNQGNWIITEILKCPVLDE